MSLPPVPARIAVRDLGRKYTATLISPALADMQVITGMAILLCGYTQLPKGLNSYHWVMVVSLAWFSSLTHLATLTSLRDYFQARPSMAACRAVFMGIVLVMLAVSYGTTGYISQFQVTGNQLAWPAQCLFSSENMSEIGKSPQGASIGRQPLFNKPLVVISIVFLVVSYLTRVVRIFGPTTGLARRWFNAVPRKIMRGGYSSTSRKAEEEQGKTRTAFHNLARLVRALVYIIAKALYDIGGSILWEIIWLTAALAWGSLRLVGLRYEASLLGIAGEDSWGFGQILPVLLTALPLWAMISTLYETRYRRQDANLPISNSRVLDVEIHSSSGVQEGENVAILDVSETTWFYKLVTLLFGFALFFIASCLYNFPAAPINNINFIDTDDLEVPAAVGLVLEQYIILFCACSVIVVVFASVCLAVRIKSTSLFPLRSRWLGIASTPLVQEIMWACLLLSLLVGLGVFDWFTFDSSTARYYSQEFSNYLRRQAQPYENDLHIPLSSTNTDKMGCEDPDTKLFQAKLK
ncbi:MAG: hypothetical protein Q9191_006652 [Dirinaria sp. TL-2023a]